MTKKQAQSKSPLFPKPVIGFFLITGATALLLSLLTFDQANPSSDWLGFVGGMIASGFSYLFGLSAFVIPACCAWQGFLLMTQKHSDFKFYLFLLFLLSLSILLSMLCEALPETSSIFSQWVYSGTTAQSAGWDSGTRYYLGGIPFYYFYIELGDLSLVHLIGKVGTFLIFGTLCGASLSLLTPIAIPWKKLYLKLKTSFDSLLKPKNKKIGENLKSAKKESRPFEGQDEEFLLSREHPLMTIKDIAPRIKRVETTARDGKKEEIIKPESTILPLSPSKDFSSYILPPTSLLSHAKKLDQSILKNDLIRQAGILEETLLSFGIEAKVGDIHCGPTITSFEVHPAVGVKVQKIKALENDIALNMQAKSIRIIAPIPGKAAVGIEVPNPHPQEVGFRELIENYQNGGKKGHIPLLLGKVVNGDDIWSDLAKMPHCIIAGATGSGKSVCINTIVMSILMNARPDEIKFVMVDPKKVELTAYSRLPHMLAPVITEPKEAHAALLWLVKEMERRYEIFRLLGIRNVYNFNTRKKNSELEESLEMDVPDRLPYIVVIIDELADLMMVSSSDIETPIARIAQMARAVGIHMILATQRPSREVITGLIKANFPTRIAFKVSSRVNSQIILDENGAECLLGNGDMLFMPPGTSTLVRAQGAFIRDEDINQVIDFVCKQAEANYLIPSFSQMRPSTDDSDEDEESSGDSLYEDAKSLVLETGNASTTFLQRKLKIGYARAASLMDQLETRGIIGPSEGAKPRKIFYPSAKNGDDEDF